MDVEAFKMVKLFESQSDNIMSWLKTVRARISVVLTT